jgi:sugar transferase (PEP-CTERM system associated)
MALELSPRPATMTGPWKAGASVSEGFELQTTGLQGPSISPAYLKSCPKTHAGRLVLNPSHVLLALDLVFLMTSQLGFLLGFHSRLFLSTAIQSWVVGVVSIVSSAALLYACGCYRRDALVRFASAISPLPAALSLAALLLVPALHFGLAPFFDQALVFRSVSRSTTIALIAMGIALPVTICGRILLFAMVRRHWFRRRVLVLGAGARAAHLDWLFNNEAHGTSTTLLFLPNSLAELRSASPQIPRNAILIPSAKSLETLAAELKIDEIVVAPDDPRDLSLEELLKCKAAGIPILAYDSFVERETDRIDLSWLDLPWFVCSPGFQLNLIDAALKRITDVVLSLVMLIVAAPVLLLAMIAVAVESGRPIFYFQQRVSRGGREFSIYKLRTMRANAETSGARWASVDDPRNTRVGGFLRRSRVDEIPQLVNVLIGDMTLVGPRPERPAFVRQLSDQIPLYQLRHGVRAGLTGWAQINFPYGASVEDARRKLEYDLYYIKNYSYVRDFAILLQTVRILLWKSGAR